MNFSTYRFTLSLHLTQSQVSLPVTLGDNARVFLITLSDGGAPYVIGDGCLAKIEIKRPTGTILQEFCPIEKNSTIIYDFSQNEGTAVVPGVHNCTITLYNAKGLVLGSPRFTMVVSDRVVTSDDMPLDDVDFTMFDAMLAKEAGRQVAENARVEAENARVSSEELRCSSEESREAAEAIRQSNERERQEAYDNRNADLEVVKNALSNKVDKVHPQAGKQYTVAAVDKDGNATSLAVDVGGYGFAIPLRETGGRIRVPAPTIDGHAINRGYLNERLSPLEERIAVLENVHKQFVTVEGNNLVIDIPDGAFPHAQIIDIYGQYSEKGIFIEDYYEMVENYPKQIITDTENVLFTMPDDVLERLPMFGVMDNYIHFEGGKVYYIQQTKVVNYQDYYGYSGNQYEGEEGESYVNNISDQYVILRLASPIVTDVTDYIGFDGIINVEGASSLTIVMKHSEEDVKNMSHEDYRQYIYRTAKTKFVFEAFV